MRLHEGVDLESWAAAFQDLRVRVGQPVSQPPAPLGQSPIACRTKAPQPLLNGRRRSSSQLLAANTG